MQQTFFFCYIMTFILCCHDQIMQQMRSDIALLTAEDNGSPIRNPSTATEDARLASLISLDGILKQVKVFTISCTFHYLSLHVRKHAIMST